MKRRLLLTLAIWTALCGAGFLALPDARAQPSYTVSSEQLQEAVAQRFPRRYAMGGLLDLTLQAPHLRLLPEQNRLGTEIVIDAAGPALARNSAGTFDVDFALRYEASDQSIRAHQLRVNSLRLSGLPPGPAALLEAYAPALANQTLLEVVVHKLRPQDLMLADGLGLEPGTITVTAKGLVIGFVTKQPR
ncbi:DUF1439 domain-containing protein [Polaromonas sp. P1(28)-8]|nr:DUF1439 domain-containing protein [Polaromonas sp. P1(28)-8]